MLKLQYFGHLMWRAYLLEKTLILGKMGERLKAKREEDNRMRWLDSINDSVHINMSQLQEIVKERGAWCAAVHGIVKSWAQLSGWKKNHKNASVLLLLQ